MLSDLITLRKELADAASASERRARDAAFRAAVEAELRALFDDPAYPARRRSFGVIRKRLGVFDADDPALKDILFTMGARVYRGEGESALWELPADTAPLRPPRLWSGYRIASALLVVALVLVAANLLAETLTGSSGLDLLARLFGGTHAACLERADGTFVEILSCHKQYDLLQRS